MPHLHAVRTKLRPRLRYVTLAMAVACATIAAPAAADPPPGAHPAAAKPAVPQAPIGLSNLIIRIDGQDEIGLAGADYRIRLIERMRELGFNALGAENLIFDKDESHRAAFRVGGIVRELECQRPASGIRCRLGVEWQVLDVQRDAVVYKVTTRSALYDVAPAYASTVGSRLLVGSLEALLRREKFRAALASHATPIPTRTDAALPAASFSACAPFTKKMPDASDQALRATVVVRAGNGFGSGFFLTTDGLVLTAAHVIAGASSIKLRLRDGSEIDAVAVRVAPVNDAALLRPVRPLTAPACLAAAAAAPPVGSELYVLGAPANMDLAFTLTRGIVSATRRLDGQHILQTDAPVNRGNSGGPMVTGDGSVVAIASFKLAGRAVEGIAFGITMSSAFEALGLTPGPSTDPSLLTGSWTAAPNQQDSDLVVDAADPPPSLDPEGDRMRARAEEERLRKQQQEAADEERRQQERQAEAQWRREQAEQRRIDGLRQAERDRQTPTYVKAMFWGGLGLVAVGGATAAWSYASYDALDTTKTDYQTLTVINTVGWATVGVGASAIGAHYILRPSLPEAQPATSPEVQVSVGPGALLVGGSF